MKSPYRRWFATPALAAFALLLAAAVSPAQEQVPPSGEALGAQPEAPVPANSPRSVAGRVVRPGTAATLPVPGVWVTLHRVGRDRAGPLDSMRTDAGGRYAFRYRTSGSPDAIYFVSAMYAGIAYFSEPLHHAEVTGDEGEITVFDTTSTAASLSVRGRHVIVSGVDSTDRRTVIEVYELVNDGSRTLVGAASGARPTWTALLPPGAANFKVGQGDVSGDALAAKDGRALVFAPFAPGIKQLSYSYTLPAGSFPLTLPLERATPVLEVLVEEPSATATAPGLAAADPVSVDGRGFKRFLAQDAPAAGVLTVDVPAAQGARMRRIAVWALVGALGVAMLLSLARAFARRPAGAAPRVARGALSPERLARQIADLDAAFERQGAPSDEARGAYRARREELKAQLTELLAARADRP